MSRAPVRGMVLGKFLPPHAGHQLLCEFARRSVDELCIVVGTLAREPIPGDLRASWMRELFPQATVVHLDQELPQDPSETPEFWPLWRSALRRVLLWPIDRVFASETYGTRLAAELGAEFVPVDLARNSRPVSGTAVRADPHGNWEFLPPPVRAYYARRVAIVGAESTGKTTLATDLAAALGTCCVPEYARLLLEPKNGRIDDGDFDRIARGQFAMEEALARQANRVLVCDTELVTTTLWADVLGKPCPDWVSALAADRDHDLYLLTDPETPFVPDPVRYRPDERRAFHDRLAATLDSLGRNVVTVTGTREARLRRALDAVGHLGGPGTDVATRRWRASAKTR